MKHGWAAFGLAVWAAAATPCEAAQAVAAPAQTVAADKDLQDARAAVEMIGALPPGAIHELYPVEIGGIQQWISVRGARRDNPLLLFVHGGPGWAMMPTSWAFQRPWEDFFTVVQWDQRGAGKTFAANGREAIVPTLTIDRMERDAEEMVLYLRKKYQKQKIILVGHSWGSALGVKLAQAHPEWFYAYVGIGQLVNMQRNEKESYRLVLAAARESADPAGLAELRAIEPYPEPAGHIPPDKTMKERDWVVHYGGMRYGMQSDDEAHLIALSPQYSAAEAGQFEAAAIASLPALWPQLESLDFDKMTSFKCPVILFAGRHDMTTPTSIAAAWFATLQAPVKKLFWFENSAHYVVNEEPGLALDHLVHDVRPLASQ